MGPCTAGILRFVGLWSDISLHTRCPKLPCMLTQGAVGIARLVGLTRAISMVSVYSHWAAPRWLLSVCVSAKPLHGCSLGPARPPCDHTTCSKFTPSAHQGGQVVAWKGWPVTPAWRELLRQSPLPGRLPRWKLPPGPSSLRGWAKLPLLHSILGLKISSVAYQQLGSSDLRVAILFEQFHAE